MVAENADGNPENRREVQPLNGDGWTDETFITVVSLANQW